MAWGLLTVEDKVRELWNRRNCSQFCDADSLPSVAKEGQVVRVGSIIYLYDGSGWIPLNEESIQFTLSGASSSQKITAQYPMVITSVEIGSPATVSLFLNGAAYTFGTLINKYDTLKVIGQGDVTGTLKGYRTTAEFFDVKVVTAVAKQSWTPSETDNIIIGIINVGNSASTTPLTIRLVKADPNFTFTPNNTDTIVLANGVTYAVNNDSFTFTEQAVRWNFTTKAGVYIQPGEALWISVPTEAVGLSGATSTFNTVLATGSGDANGFNNSFISDTIEIV